MTITGGPASRSRAGYAGHRRDSISPSIPRRKLNKLKRPSLVNASGAPMQVEGTATVNICANSLMCSIDAVISLSLIHI